MEYAIIRCRGRDTLPLVMGLLEYDVEAWSPLVRQRVRVARKRKVIEKIRPAMPSFVFVHRSDLGKCLWLGGRRIVPSHTTFKMNGEVVFVPERELEPLRSLEDQSRQASPSLPVGAKVEIVSGPFKEMRGAVVASNDDYLMVHLEDFLWNLKLAPFLVRPIRL